MTLVMSGKRKCRLRNVVTYLVVKDVDAAKEHQRHQRRYQYGESSTGVANADGVVGIVGVVDVVGVVGVVGVAGIVGAFGMILPVNPAGDGFAGTRLFSWGRTGVAEALLVGRW